MSGKPSMEQTTPTDTAVREKALDPRLCCIVQAPAGSGKTELLIQRMLVLLAQVERPEEILAITFTRKAAGEMRARIQQALREAGQPLPEGASDHLRRQRERARAALARDRALGWNILEQPGRLRIQTIDSLCAGLSARLPLTARFGASVSINQQPDELYSEAAAHVLERIEAAMDQDGDDVRAVETLLRHLGNDLNRVRDLLAAMLARRDQWLRHVGAAQRESLEAALRRMVEDELTALHELFPDDLKAETSVIATALCANLAKLGIGDADARMQWRTSSWPAPGIAGLAQWHGLADLLLTANGEWRKSLTEKNGVPPPSKTRDKEEQAERSAFKTRVRKLLGALREHPELAERLHACRSMPEPHYSDGEWAVLNALLHLLQLAVAELSLVFAARGEVDFIESAQGAIRALGEPDAPSDLLLAFDYRIRHILVDEFQDTSHTQFALLERLIAGWQPGATPYTEAEGRSLFLVGDPMQSIYRFREAEVGLFLRARREGISCGAGILRLAPLTLSTNFRSQAGVVEWVNTVFPHVLAERENIAEGAVCYTPSIAYHPHAPGEAVRIRLIPSADDETVPKGEREAAEVLRLTRAALETLDDDGEGIKPGDRAVAILVRSRGALVRILPALRRAGIAFQAVEIEQLADQPIAQDLLALTRALLHPADRIAWLALLRAPWCGLDLADLHALAGELPETQGAQETLWQAMQDEARLARMSAEGRARLVRVREVMAASLADSGRISLRRQVEAAWLALGGAACLRDEREREEARIVLDLLDTLEPPLSPDALEQALQGLFAPPAGEARVQVMTIHKSKGLQFHTVILPGLARTPRAEDSPLLMWLERETTHPGRRETELLLAPIKGQGETEALLYTWLRRIQEARGAYEDGRLLYVAATRAIQRLHIVAETPLDRDGKAWKPPARCMLARLWPGISALVEPPPASLDEEGYSQKQEGSRGLRAAPTLRRLPADWQPPPPPPGIQVQRAGVQAISGLRPSAAVNRWDELQSHGAFPAHRLGAGGDEAEAGAWHEGEESLRHVGTLVHRLLETIALQGLAGWDEARLKARLPALRRVLTETGVAAARLDEAVQRVVQAVCNTLADARGRWILAAHEDARCEWALGGLLNGVPVSAVIDRSFIHEGVRWIIDYKTSEPRPGESQEDFLDRQQAHYRAQLQGYAALMRLLEPDRPVRLGLYFPLTGGWREWAA